MEICRGFSFFTLNILVRYPCSGTTVSHHRIDGFRSSRTAVLPHKNIHLFDNQQRMNDIQNLYTEENEFKKKTNEFFGILIGGCISEKDWNGSWLEPANIPDQFDTLRGVQAQVKKEMPGTILKLKK